MNNFWSLTCFEYKKIFCKKSRWIALLIALSVQLLFILAPLLGNYYIDGKAVESRLSQYQKTREEKRKINGRPLDSGLLLEASAVYANYPSDSDIHFYNTEEYAAMLPYEWVYFAYSRVNDTGLPEFQNMTQEQAGSFYQARKELVSDIVRSYPMSDNAKDAVLAMDDQVKTPFTLSFFDGYATILSCTDISGLMGAFLLCICIAPIFSGEYTSGADQLLLSSRHGKRSLLAAKLFTGFSLAAILSLFFTLTLHLVSLISFGTDGGDSPIQLMHVQSPYPLTLKEAAVIMAVTSLLGALLTAAVTMLLSSRMKSPFGVITPMMITLFIPIIIYPPEINALIYHLFTLLPVYSMRVWVMLDIMQFELPGLVVKPYIFLPIFSALACIVTIPFTCRNFRKHQVS